MIQPNWAKAKDGKRQINYFPIRFWGVRKMSPKIINRLFFFVYGSIFLIKTNANASMTFDFLFVEYSLPDRTIPIRVCLTMYKYIFETKIVDTPIYLLSLCFPKILFCLRMYRYVNISFLFRLFEKSNLWKYQNVLPDRNFLAPRELQYHWIKDKEPNLKKVFYF